MGLTSDEEDEESTPIIRWENGNRFDKSIYFLLFQLHHIPNGGRDAHSAVEYL